MEFNVYIEDGKITNKKTVKGFFTLLDDGRYKITIQKSNKRTLQQNNWLHAVLPDILDGLRNMGYNELKTNEDAKTVVKALFFKKTITNGIEEIEVIEDTSKTSKEDFVDRANQIITWAKEYLGIDIAPPLKQVEMFAHV